MLMLAVDRGPSALRPNSRRGADVRYDLQLRTAPHYAAQQDSARLVQALLQKGALIDAADIDGLTPLHLVQERNAARLRRARR